MLVEVYACGAPTGQTLAQDPQSIQVSGSITYLPSPSEIAFTGHSASQAPQLIHSSLITYAIGKNTSFTFGLILTHLQLLLQYLFLNFHHINQKYTKNLLSTVKN